MTSANFKIVFWRGNVRTGTRTEILIRFLCFCQDKRISKKKCQVLLFHSFCFVKVHCVILNLLCFRLDLQKPEPDMLNFSFRFFFQGKRVGKKKKTSVKSCNLNPYWNESFVFLIDEMDMKRVYLDVTVCVIFYKYQRQITLRILGYHFSSRQTATLNLCPFISNFLCMCSNSVNSAHVILKKIRQRLRVAVSQEEKRYPTILRVICL